jgi:hypothetical protein
VLIGIVNSPERTNYQHLLLILSAYPHQRSNFEGVIVDAMNLVRPQFFIAGNSDKFYYRLIAQLLGFELRAVPSVRYGPQSFIDCGGQSA